MRNNSGSAVLWLFLGGLFAMILIAAFMWSKVFTTTEGIEPEQVNTYQQTLDKANELKTKSETPPNTDIYNGSN